MQAITMTLRAVGGLILEIGHMSIAWPYRPVKLPIVFQYPSFTFNISGPLVGPSKKLLFDFFLYNNKMR